MNLIFNNFEISFKDVIKKSRIYLCFFFYTRKRKTKQKKKKQERELIEVCQSWKSSIFIYVFLIVVISFS